MAPVLNTKPYAAALCTVGCAFDLAGKCADAVCSEAVWNLQEQEQLYSS